MSSTHLFLDYIRDDPAWALAWVLVIVFSICFHEMTHAWVALRNGDDTAARTGHLTMNPLRQMGWISLMMLVVFGFAWGAVPVNPFRLTRGGRVRVAAAGPLSNLLLCVVFALAAALVVRLGGSSAPKSFSAADLMAIGAQANGVLFVLNILPIPGLDGWGVLAALVASFEAWAMRNAAIVTWILFFVLIASPAFTYIFKVGQLLAGLMIFGFRLLLG